MENWETWQDKINLYLNNEMSISEVKAFEDELAVNSQLATEVELNKAMKEGAITFGSRELKSKLQNFHSKNFPDQTQKNNNINKYGIAILVALIFACLIGLYLFLNSPKTKVTPSPQKLYAEYYQPFDLSSQVRDIDQNTTLDFALSSYKKGQYKNAIILFDSLLIQDSQNSVVLLSRANAHSQTSQFLKAHKDFDQIISSNDPYLKYQAIWFKALTYLKQDNLEGAKKHLSLLVQNPDADFNKEATELLGKLQ